MCGSPFREAVANRQISWLSRKAVSCWLSLTLPELFRGLGRVGDLCGLDYLRTVECVPAEEQQDHKIRSSYSEVPDSHVRDGV